ncbi:MAG: hydroxyacid dehydrogenase [Planctomycetaceae bacterium]|nr:hydroxyacid dehydrogenase [Planctomycetaceae bacterium]
MFRLWVDEKVLESVMPMLDGVAEIIGPGAPLSELTTCDAALDPGVPWTAERMDQAGRLKVLSRIGVGYDNINVQAATERGIVVCYTPHGPTISTAEHTVALIFAAAKTVAYADRDIRARRWHSQVTTLKGMELQGRTLGIVGAGRIGCHVAKIMQAVGMSVVAFDPVMTDERAAKLGISKAGSLNELLGQSDVVSLHAPSNESTRHLMNPITLSQMKRGAILINTARGALVDEAALTDALRSGHLAAAGLDVFQKEPIQTDNPLLSLDNVVFTDHIASHTWAGHHRLYEMAVRHVLQVMRGEDPDSFLNPQVVRRA